MNDGDGHGDGDRRKKVEIAGLSCSCNFRLGWGYLGLYLMLLPRLLSPLWSGRAGQGSGRSLFGLQVRYALTHFTRQGTDVHGRFREQNEHARKKRGHVMFDSDLLEEFPGLRKRLRDGTSQRNVFFKCTE